MAIRALRPDPTWRTEGWLDYFRNDLIRSLDQDVSPLIGSEGFFGVVRQVCCYIDYLGALRSGKGVATTDSAKNFIKDIFKNIDEDYEKSANCFVKAYRHGLVHTYAPKILIRPHDNNELWWGIYNGDREGELKTSIGIINVKHMRIVQLSGAYEGVHYLPISNPCLVDDLRSAIKLFYQELEQEKSLRKNVLLRKLKRAATKISQPEQATW